MKSKKMLLVSLLSVFLVSCGITPVSSAASDVDAKGFKVITTSNVIDGQTSEFHVIPKEYQKTSEKKGKIERVDYTTDVYENGVTYSKHANVYVPYEYDAAKKYNIMYFQHGDKSGEDALVKEGEESETKLRLDNLFDKDKGGIEPCLVVFQTFYLEGESAGHSDKDLAGDGYVTSEGESVPPNYYLEVNQDLIPAVESKYSTYASGDVSDANIKATRDHRAFSGYSRGSARCWAMFIQDLDYFKWYLPMSFPCIGTKFIASQIGEMGTDTANEASWAEMKTTIDAHKDLSFYIYGSTGNKNDIPAMRAWCNYLSQKTDYISYGLDTSKNNFAFTVSLFDHSDFYCSYYWYNTLQVVFH
ncbi:MAG: hypothetical protein WCR67_04620 [Bacilli bacterium]